MEVHKVEKKMKILCLHGFRTSGSFLEKQISKWNPSIFAHFDLVCLILRRRFSFHSFLCFSSRPLSDRRLLLQIKKEKCTHVVKKLMVPPTYMYQLYGPAPVFDLTKYCFFTII